VIQQAQQSALYSACQDSHALNIDENFLEKSQNVFILFNMQTHAMGLTAQGSNPDR
jgi:hypothetical protein